MDGDNLSAFRLEPGDRAVLADAPAQILQCPGISLHGALRVGVAAKTIVHAAKAVVARERDHRADLIGFEQIDAVAHLVVHLGDVVILAELFLRHRHHDAFFLVLGRIAEQRVHFRPHALFFLEQRALVVGGPASVAARGFPADDALVEHSDSRARAREPPARAEARDAAANDDDFHAAGGARDGSHGFLRGFATHVQPEICHGHRLMFPAMAC